MKPDYLGVLYVWLFFFAALGFFLVPAFRLRKIAKAHGKKGWVFFLVGISIGIGVILFNRMIAFFIQRFEIIMTVRDYLWIPYLLVGYGIVFIAIDFVAERWIKSDQIERVEEVIDHNLFEEDER